MHLSSATVVACLLAVGQALYVQQFSQTTQVSPTPTVIDRSAAHWESDTHHISDHNARDVVEVENIGKPKPQGPKSQSVKAPGVVKSSSKPKSSAPPKASGTPKPSATLKVSGTPKSSGTPKASRTPKPTGTPRSSGTPKPPQASSKVRACTKISLE
jgi:hypothetical protein